MPRRPQRSSGKTNTVNATAGLVGVRIACQDETPDNTVLGVFATEADAGAFSDEVMDRCSGGVICSHFKLGYRYGGGTGHVTYGPPQ